ncbi:NAD(P)H-dependent glycerol-3-phosphate dehydrogenase [Cryomorpha ignava]|uniref:Glycerol-3-phosphate dehydrogenase [NAD(P)+] n=1 Tax=Cryomorpha ignava TaxID=101383 RepID=A0A7K3WTG8_9FLAO|nr:NAD(P)H-dependent glycerol-3-phosphate dehydrogenase [Cryomorpha ignava]NEN24784.1 NAD(P)H-dependent glycerol-3-phosphate dehydrogenase [Cryomorpha ignava]
MASDKRIGVIGGGSWATALAKIVSDRNDTFSWWMRNPESVEHIKKYYHNPKYLRAVEFDVDRINITSNVQEVVENSDVLIVAVPSAFVHASLKDVPKELFEGKIIFSAIKGIIPEIQSIPARYFFKTFGVPYDNIGIICGPCHAEEVAMERLSYLTCASMNEENAKLMAEMLSTRYVKTSTSDDLFGAEIAAILKNIYAIAAGVCGGLGYGDNFQAVLLSAAIIEMERFLDKLNPFHRDVKEPAYLGDLLVTSYSKFSRNRTFGYMLGKGYSAKAAQLEMDMIAEGYYATKSVYEMNHKFDVDMPIADAVYNIIYERISPVIEIRILADTLG